MDYDDSRHSSTHLDALFWRHFTAAPRASMSTQLLSLPQLGHLPLVGSFVIEQSTCRHTHFVGCVKPCQGCPAEVTDAGTLSPVQAQGGGSCLRCGVANRKD